MKIQQRQQWEDGRKILNESPPNNTAIGKPCNSKTRKIKEQCPPTIYHPQHEKNPPKEDLKLNITSEMPVDVMIKDSTEINKILRMVCACFNSRDGFELILMNKRHQKAKTADFDVWYDRIEKKMKRCFFNSISKYIGIYGNCNSEKITINVKQRAPHLCSIETYLYYPSVSAVEQVSYTEAINILEKPRQINKAEVVKIKSCGMFETLEDFRNENDNLQFKAITGDNVSTALSNMCLDHYISAFCNHKGGLILFGIEDSEGKVVGVTMHNKTDIENKLKEKIACLKFGSFDGKMVKGFNWDIDYLAIKMDGEFYRVKGDDDIIFLKYCKKEEGLELIEKSSPEWWTLRNCKQSIGLARADSFVEDQSTWYKVSKNDGLFKKNDIVKIIGTEEESKFKCKSAHGKIGLICQNMLVKDSSKRYIAKCDDKGKKPYENGEVLRLISKDTDKWWTFETVSSTKKQLPASVVKALNVKTGDNIDGSEKNEEVSEKTKVIALSVGFISGGVFTADPESYYADDEGKVHKYTFKEWKSQMKKSEKEKVATKGDIDNLREEVNQARETDRQNQQHQNWNNEQIEICNVDIGNIVSYYMETKALGDLTDALNSTRHVFLKGMNGAGKSQLALKYAQRQKEQSRHSYIIWKLNCLNIDELQTALSFFNKKLGCYMQNPNFAEICQSYGHSIVSKLTTICQMHKDLSPIILLENVNVKTLENAIVFLKQLTECPSVKVIATTQINPGLSFKVLEINGFTEDECRKFLNDDEIVNEQEKQLYLTLSEKISWNPLGLFICKTFMTNHCYSIKKMNTFIDTPCKWRKIDNIVDHSEGEDKLVQCLLSVLHQIKEDDKELFKLWTVLTFLDTNEGLPLILLEFFSRQIGLADDFTVEKFVKKIKHASFGSISDKDDYRLLKTHNVIILALRLDLEATDPNDLVSKRPYLQCLLESLMMLISEDNRSSEDIRMHALMLPHAIVVVKHAEELLAEFESEMTDAIEFKIPLMYVNHLIGYTLSVRRRSVQATHYLTRAKQLIVSLIDLEESEFESGQQTDHCNTQNAHENAKQLLEKSDTFLNKNRAFHSKFVKWFTLGKRRSEKEKESLRMMLNKPSFTGQLTEKEHMKLVKAKNALSFDDMQSLLFLELVISIFYTYGRQIFYLDDKKHKDSKMFPQYLKVAYYLSSKINDRYPNLYWQRICSRGGTIKLMFLDPVQHENIAEHWESIKKLLTQEKRKEFRYYQFGILKMDELITDQVTWLKLLVKYYILLYKTPKEESSKTHTYLLQEGQKVVDDLIELGDDIKDLTTYYSSLSTIVEWYDCIEKHETAFEYFKRTMEDKFVKEYEFNKYQERALEIYIRHLVKSCQNQKAQEVLSEYGCGIRNDKFFTDMRTLMPSPIQQQDS